MPALAMTPAAPWPMARGFSAHASSAIAHAPTTPPTVPNTDIAPEVPLGACRPVVSRRGSVGENAPISVAQVAAVGAGGAAAAIDQRPHSAAAAATPPVATTCRRLR